MDKCEWLSLAVHMLLLVIAVLGHEGHQHYQPRPDHREDLLDKKLREDRQHLKEDIEEYLKLNPEVINAASSKELEYFYFVMHDFDKNNKLDAHEVTRAVLHIMEHDGRTDSKDFNAESLSVGLDTLIKQDDIDGDGFLSYAEYIVSRQKEEMQMREQL